MLNNDTNGDKNDVAMTMVRIVNIVMILSLRMIKIRKDSKHII